MFDIFNIQPARETVVCKDGFSMSVQASVNHYCSPKLNGKYETYSSVEIGFPSEIEELLIDYAENPDKLTNTVYAYVPAKLTLDIIEKHGGMINGELPKLEIIKQGE